MKKYLVREYLTGKKKNIRRTAGLMVLMAGLWCFPAFADGWVCLEDQGWKYEEQDGYASGWREINGSWYYFDDAGLMQTGWIQAKEDQLWYYLDLETGAWVRRPALNDTSVVKLLENEIMRAGYYQHEDGEVYVQVDWRDETTIYASVREQTGPNDTTTLNTYEINKKSGSVTAAAGGNFSLYQ